ncbi:hypothetical protein SAMN05444287_2968 [Octadecabacter temperatus]|uniref:Uncharacterized protein n=1 Tax=Octadecabacter temperatus TaxID=1458307 RepID=A0A0K0Y8U6_9RHOB|nr:hypothetical protein [Octadecabacter temperatus]AKS47388.1 hypothetical protein OSB_28650 [Octadecabacter temperatus]SIO43226.1 hypothetical protein SAMN05444287_2968 [Octadecabacter temperatus]
MLPFDMDVITAPVCVGPMTLTAPVLAPVVKDFDPRVERLTFKLSTKDADADLFLHNFLNGSDVQVEVDGRVIVTLLGCSADDIPEDCLTFEFED